MWEWVTGEPLGYVNWAEAQPEGGPAAGADYALMSWMPRPRVRGLWRAVDPTGSDWHRVRKAIVEKPPVEDGEEGVIVTPMQRRVAVAPGSQSVVELVVRNASKRERLMTFRVAEMVTDDTGATTAVEGAAGYLALVDPDAMMKPFAPWETRTIQLRASLPPGAEVARTVLATVAAGPERESAGPTEPAALTVRVGSVIEIVPEHD